jgi:hypothetical protein
MKTKLTRDAIRNRLYLLKPCLGAAIGLAFMTAAFYVASPSYVAAEDSKPEKQTKSEKTAGKKAEKKKLSGADLYAIHCNRCHPERYATERTAAQWKTLMLHMRVRANLPAEQAKAILKFLQEDSGK